MSSSPGRRRDLAAVEGERDRGVGSTSGAMPWCDVTTGSAMADTARPSTCTRNSSRNIRMAEAIDDGMRRAEHADRRLLRRPGDARARCCRTRPGAGRGPSRPVAVLDAAQDPLEPARCPRGTACTGRTTRAQKKRVIRHAARTTQVVSSMTTIEPEPSIEPASPTSSWPSGRSRCSGPNHGAETPPGMNALSSRPSRMPPPRRGS